MNTVWKLVQDHDDLRRAKFLAMVTVSTSAYGKTMDQLIDEELIKIRAARIEEQAETDAKKIFEEARRRGIARAASSYACIPKKAAEAQLATWVVNKPQRFQGYAEPLYNVLKDAHDQGQNKPTVYEVLENFKANQPTQVAIILPGQGLDYYTAAGSTKSADLNAIREAIRKMTTQKPL